MIAKVSVLATAVVPKAKSALAVQNALVVAAALINSK